MRLATASLVLLLGMVLNMRASLALQFEQVQVSPSEVMIGGRGPIVRGDATRLEQLLAALPQSVRLLGLAFDSPGGNVAEGIELATVIRARQLAVAIPANSTCASACFLLLAATRRGFVAKNALIGVHGVSESGQDTTVAKAMTIDMARAARDLGVPSSIIGQLVPTEPARVQWLQESDLRSMGVVVYDGMDAATVVRQPALAVAPPAPAKSPAAEGSASLAFQSGLADRRLWDAWIATLHGAYKDGAMFWASQRLMQQPASCHASNGANQGEFTLGCEAARQRLSPMDARRRSNADYGTGWDSMPTQATMPAQAVAEFQGVMFCQQQPTHLSLKVLPTSDTLHRQAVFSFGPTPSGSLTMEGRLDLEGGSIDLRPLASGQHPDGSWAVGLEGHSEDGGKVFTGRVTASRSCTLFTLKRIG